MKGNNDRIKEIRESLGITQIELAKKVGVTQAAISAIERGEIKSPSVDTARAIATALGVSLEEIFPTPEPQTQTI